MSDAVQHERVRASTEELGPLEQLRAPRRPRRFAQLAVGLVMFGTSIGMLVRSDLGLPPWDVFHSGVAAHVPWTFGTVVVVSSFAVLLMWVPLRQMPGLATFANAVGVGATTDLTLSLLPPQHGLPIRWGLLLGGVVLNGLATALYIGSRFGPGPRDGLMTGLHARTGWSLRVIRTGIEIAVLGTGWVLGGAVGFGTLLYALAIGPLVQAFMPRCRVDLSHPAARDETTG